MKIKTFALAALAFFCGGGEPSAAPVYDPVLCFVRSVADGDTINVTCTDASPYFFQHFAIRIWNLDTPESRTPADRDKDGKPDWQRATSGFAKCEKEARLGVSAKAWARSKFSVGAPINFTFKSWDRNGGRIVATVRLPNGRDYATDIARVGLGVTGYKGIGRKPNYCK